eukprot:1156358-Pelagomonas_calceolata.AAC.2
MRHVKRLEGFLGGVKVVRLGGAVRALALKESHCKKKGVKFPSDWPDTGYQPFPLEKTQHKGCQKEVSEVIPQPSKTYFAGKYKFCTEWMHSMEEYLERLSSWEMHVRNVHVT